MTQVMVFQKPVFKRYYSGVLSTANCFNVFLWALVLILPFLAGYSSHNFWIKESTFREQPDIQFKKKLLMIMEVKNDDRESSTDPMGPAAEYSKVLTFSTNANINELNSASTLPLVLESSKSDVNRDGLTDSLTLTLTAPISTKDRVHRVAVVAIVQYALKDRTNMVMESVAYLDHSSPLPGRALIVDGDLRLHQRVPLTLKGGAQSWYMAPDEMLLEANENSAASDFLLENMLQGYNARNFTTRLETSSEFWLSAAPLALGESNRNFFVNLTMRVPLEEVEYFTDWSECMKFAFVQYVPLFLVAKYLLNWLRKYIYENQVLESQYVIDTQFGVQKKHQF
eukprot:g6048.t1